MSSPDSAPALSPDAPRETPASDAPAPKPPKRKISNLSVIWRFTRHYPMMIVGALLALIVSSLATSSMPIMLKLVIDNGFKQGSDLNRISIYFEAMLLIAVILAIATAIRFYAVSWLGERTVADMRLAVQRNLLRMPPGWFEENRPSEIASRMTSDTMVVEQVVGSTISIALRNFLTGSICLVLMFILAPKIAIYLVIGIPMIVVPIVWLGGRVRKLSRTSQDRVADVGSTVNETMNAMRIVQAFGQEEREAVRFEGAVALTFAAAKRRFAMRALMTAMVMGLLFAAITLIMWDAVSGVAAGRTTGGAIAGFVIASGLVTGSFGALTEVYGDLMRASGAASRMSELLELEPAIAAPATPVPLPRPSTGSIRFDHVTFRYPSRPEISALDDFSLDVASGETVAIVGPSGAGKSTIFQLVQRFYDPQGGEIHIDGVPIRLADPAEIRARMALVPQEMVIFAASARDNLRYGDWSASDDAIWQAAEAANAADFLRALPEGLDTYLGEGGARLSGGQRQRIAIARALLRDSPILLLDEATSALDAESERLVQSALEHLMEGRTTLVIAHRLATVRAAGRIIVMDGGRIVETGTHAELVALDGLYARLASLQFNDAA